MARSVGVQLALGIASNHFCLMREFFGKTEEIELKDLTSIDCDFAITRIRSTLKAENL